MSNQNTTSHSSGDGGMMRHAKVPLPSSTMHGTHPFKHKKNHKDLLEYLQARLAIGKSARDAELPRLVRIDKNMAGWMRASEEDRKRLAEKDANGMAQAVNMNLPLSFVHVDDMMTYFAETFAPSRGMFYHTASPDETSEASQIIVKMNNDAIYSGYFREVLRGIYTLLKYNYGGYCVVWGRDEGPKLDKNEQNETVIDTEVKWEGNRLKALDRYNLLADPSVPVTDLHKDGEFAATAMLRSHYWLKHRASRGVYFNCEEALQRSRGLQSAAYYRSPPAEAMLESDDSKGGATDWVSVLSEAQGTAKVDGFEVVELYIRLNPTEFGLVPARDKAARDRYEIWRFTILDNTWIIAADWMSNAHGHIPYYMGLINDDAMGVAQKSVAEILQPLQDFSSFLLNIHVQASRSSLWGTTYYDPSVVDLAQVKRGEVNATIPIMPTGYGKDIRNAVYKAGGTLETKQTLSDLQGMMDIINQFFPTQALPSQIASIDRAVESQVAAVQHGANRRQQKTARLLDDSVFSKIRYAMYYNILQYLPEDVEEIQDYYSGKPVKVDLAAMRNTNMPFIIGQGLKAIDRQATAGMMQNIIFALIQAPQAAQGIDLLGLIDYWTSMIDVDIDMKQFRLAPPEEGGEAPEVDAEGNPVRPATSGAVIAGGPIYDD